VGHAAAVEGHLQLPRHRQRRRAVGYVGAGSQPREEPDLESTLLYVLSYTTPHTNSI
jgi:hypothetical protein